jgi:glycerol-3-phosphate dehydrogenase
VPVLSLVGGKWTTFRALGAHLADRALEVLGRPRRVGTKGRAIGGGRGFPVTAAARSRWLDEHAGALGRERMELLLERYGTLAVQVRDAICADADDRPLGTAPHYSTAEIRHLARTESVHHLDDILLRRTNLAFTGRATPACAEEVAVAVAAVLGWDDSRRAEEVGRALAAVRAAEPRGSDTDDAAAAGARVPDTADPLA